VQYPSIRIEGAILSSDIIDAIENGDKGFQKAKDFGLDPTSRVKDEIANAWADARDQWRIFRRKADELKEGKSGTTETRNFWMTPFLGLLGFQPELARKGEDVNGRNYAISHRDIGRGSFPIHIVGCNDSLDRRRQEGGMRMSPHALVQEYLNLTEHLYAVVTNGSMLRLLRDSTRLIKLSFLEFDLDRMFEEELYADFAILFRLMHASRMPQAQEFSAESIIEIYHQDALDSGSRIRAGLSEAVEKSIIELANGFLHHADNAVLTDAIASGQLKEKTYYQWMLRLIYRLLFLMVIEERDLIYPKDADNRHRKIYYDYYSIGRIRNLSEHRHFADKNYHDAWAGLRNTFLLFEDSGYGAKLGIAPLAGELFDERAIGLLNECQLNNEILLTCLNNLSVFTNPVNNQRMRVNYAALNVEEFGSVYEGLLEYDPQLVQTNGHFTFSFVKGSDRSASGSHYTPDELVQPLIKHSLDYIIADKLKEPDPQQALLSITVCDVACGSGHILLNAARRIGTELAILRTGEDQPSPIAFRAAVRDVVRNCIYGVDLNPLAVELCKVALWLEAHVPGEPINFLDHHIKCGNAIVGLAHQDELNRGIPNEAFKTLPGDDKDLLKELRKENKDAHKAKDLQHKIEFEGRAKKDIVALRSAYDQINELPESSPTQIREKRAAYNSFLLGQHIGNLKTLANIQVSQFYIPKTLENRRKITTQETYRRYMRGEVPHAEPTAFSQAIANRKKFFHWFLEFPEVFSNGGFDCIPGNPPYLKAQNISRNFGKRVFEYLKVSFDPAGGLADLVTYFLRRNDQISNSKAFYSLITTNSISQGDTRKFGLGHLVSNNRKLAFAIRSRNWPGRASVVISIFSVSKSASELKCVLDGQPVPYISSLLTTEEDRERFSLKANEKKCFVGSYVLGDGFDLAESQALVYQRTHPSEAKFIQRYVGGVGYNNDVDSESITSIINFHDLRIRGKITSEFGVRTCN
jgi:methylase of polypeptide subunit release factors